MYVECPGTTELARLVRGPAGVVAPSDRVGNAIRSRGCAVQAGALRAGDVVLRKRCVDDLDAGEGVDAPPSAAWFPNAAQLARRMFWPVTPPPRPDTRFSANVQSTISSNPAVPPPSPGSTEFCWKRHPIAAAAVAADAWAPPPSPGSTPSTALPTKAERRSISSSLMTLSPPPEPELAMLDATLSRKVQSVISSRVPMSPATPPPSADPTSSTALPVMTLFSICTRSVSMRPMPPPASRAPLAVIGQFTILIEPPHTRTPAADTAGGHTVVLGVSAADGEPVDARARRGVEAGDDPDGVVGAVLESGLVVAVEVAIERCGVGNPVALVAARFRTVEAAEELHARREQERRVLVHRQVDALGDPHLIAGGGRGQRVAQRDERVRPTRAVVRPGGVVVHVDDRLRTCCERESCRHCRAPQPAGLKHGSLPVASNAATARRRACSR